MLENSNTGVGGAKVNTNSTLLCHLAKLFRARSEIAMFKILFSSFVLHNASALVSHYRKKLAPLSSSGR